MTYLTGVINDGYYLEYDLEEDEIDVMMGEAVTECTFDSRLCSVKDIDEAKDLVILLNWYHKESLK